MRKVLLLILVLSLVIVSLSGCAEKKKTVDEAITEAVERSLENVDENNVFKLRFDLEWKNGNTLCKNCGAINRGHVDICTYCGRRISRT